MISTVLERASESCINNCEATLQTKRLLTRSDPSHGATLQLRSNSSQSRRGIYNCLGSEAILHIHASLCSLYSPMTLPAFRHPTLHPLPRPPLRQLTRRLFRLWTPSSPYAQSLVPSSPPPPKGGEAGGGWSGSCGGDTAPRTPDGPLPPLLYKVDALDSPPSVPARSGQVPPRLAPPAVYPDSSPPSPGACIVLLAANCLAQLSGGLLAPATSSSPAAEPAL